MKVHLLTVRLACRLLSVYLLCCILSQGHSQPAGNAFTFTGAIANKPTGYVYLAYVDSSNHYLLDSCALMDGNFIFKGYLSSPQMASFYLDGISTRGLNGGNFSLLFIEPGIMQGYFPESDFKHSKISGSVSQATYIAYTKHLDLLAQAWKTAFAIYKKEKRQKNFIVFREKQTQYELQKKTFTWRFIRQHPQSYVSAGLLQNEMFNLSYDSLKLYYSRLAPTVRTGVEGKIIGDFIRKEEAIAVGKPAPDFAQPDSSGAPVWLHDFKGQYVLLDFWASWCVPCRQEHPYLRQAYAKFKDKGFTIFSVSIDEKRFEQAWLAAIQKDTLTWPQVCDFTAWQNKVVDTYNVLNKGIPASFLINPQGIIVAMNLRGESLEKKLTELMTN